MWLSKSDRENKRVGFGESNGDCKSSSKTLTSDGSADAAVAEVMSKGGAAVATKAPSAELPHGKDAAGDPLMQKSGGGIFTKDPKCMKATTCSACAALSGGHCFWNSTAAKCMVGDPSRLMCTLDTLTSNVVYLVLVGVVGCIVLVVCAACGVCFYRKRQSAANDAAVDAEEAFETRVPLTSEGRSFLRRNDGDDDRVETF